MRNLKIGRWIISLISVFTIVSPFTAEFNETHIYNPNWSPHAKFHDAQTMLLGALLGGIALFFLWRRERDRSFQFKLAVLFAGLYWFAQMWCIFFPGTGFVDPEFANRMPKLFGFPLNQSIFDFFILIILALGYRLEKIWP
jgi:tryptophan-rich sensory protein